MSHFSVAVITKTNSVDEIDQLLLPYREYDGEDWMKPYIQFEEDEEYDVDDETGKHGHWYNPNATWDWYSVGGRFDGAVRPFTKLKDIDYSVDEKEYEYRCREWEVIVDGAEQKDGEDFWMIYKPKYYTERYGTKENYATICSTFGTFAMLTPDDKWYENGHMGWFGLDDGDSKSIDTFTDMQREYITNPENGEYYLTIVDCHI